MLTEKIKKLFKKQNGILLDEISKNPKLLEIFKDKKIKKSSEKILSGKKADEQNLKILSKW